MNLKKSCITNGLTCPATAVAPSNLTAVVKIVRYLVAGMYDIMYDTMVVCTLV